LNDSILENLDILICDIDSGSSEQNELAQHLMSRLSPDGVLILTDPYATSIHMIEICMKNKIKILGIVENMANIICPNCNTASDLFQSHRIRTLANEKEITYLGGIQFNEVNST
jgi:ATP-binding protein involved in chromosome partitioning